MSGPSRLRWTLGTLLVLMAVATAILFAWPDTRTQLIGAVERFLEWARGLGPGGAVILGLMYVPACLLFVPGSLLTLGIGFSYGLEWGTLIVSLGSTLGATVAFLAGRTLARPWLERRLDERFRALDEAVARQGFKIVLLTRLSPVIPFNLLNYALGLTRVSLRDYVLASWIGMFPGTVMYVYLGAAAGELSDLMRGDRPKKPGEQVLFYGGLLATIVLTVVLTRTARRALRKALPDSRLMKSADTGKN